MNRKSLLLLFTLLLLSASGLLAESLAGLTVGLSIECSSSPLRQAFSTALTNHLKKNHGVDVVGNKETAEILVRVSVVDLNPDGENTAFSIAGNVESRLDERVALALYGTLRSQHPSNSALVDFLGYLSKDNVLPVIRFHETGGSEVIERLFQHIDKGMSLVAQQRSNTVKAVARLAAASASRENNEDELQDGPRPAARSQLLVQ